MWLQSPRNSQSYRDLTHSTTLCLMYSIPLFFPQNNYGYMIQESFSSAGSGESTSFGGGAGGFGGGGGGGR